MLNEVLTVVVSFLIALLSVPVIIRIAREKKLYDEPDARKLHTRPIASLGGVGIFIAFTLSALFFISMKEAPEFQAIMAASIVVFFLGLKDDILIISASKKLLGQIAAAAIIIHIAHIRIDSMHGMFNIYQLPELVSILLTYTAIIVITNAFNLIDGVDGLAGSLGVLTTVCFGIYFFQASMPAYAMMAFAMSGSLVAFLIYNRHPAKIFMGDSGSLLVGLINSVLVIKFITVADSNAGTFPIQSSVAIGFSILFVPLFDTLRVFSMRMLKGRSPFSPDRNHVHHLLVDKGFNHTQVTFSCVAFNALFIAIAYLTRSLGSTIVLSCMIATAFTVIRLLVYLKKASFGALRRKADRKEKAVRPLIQIKRLMRKEETAMAD